jgi:hypothetical protein
MQAEPEVALAAPAPVGFARPEELAAGPETARQAPPGVAEAVVAPAAAVELAARDSAASRENIPAPEAPGPRRRLLPLLVRRSPGSLFGKAEHPFRIGDISS